MKSLKMILDEELGGEISFMFKHLSDEEKGEDEPTSFQSHLTDSKLTDAKFSDFLDNKLAVKEAFSCGVGSNAHAKHYIDETRKLDSENSVLPQYKVDHYYVDFFEMIF